MCRSPGHWGKQAEPVGHPAAMHSRIAAQGQKVKWATITRDSIICARLGWTFYGSENFILKTIRFSYFTTVWNVRKHLKKVNWTIKEKCTVRFDRTVTSVSLSLIVPPDFTQRDASHCCTPPPPPPPPPPPRSNQPINTIWRILGREVNMAIPHACLPFVNFGLRRPTPSNAIEKYQ